MEMSIIINNNNSRVLIKENGTEVNVNDGDIIQYTGIYYKTIRDIVETVKIETGFIGVIEACKYTHDNGIMGIYVKPLYIWDMMNSEWYKLVNLNPPRQKYFLYPHLLMMFKYNYYPSVYNPLYFLDTCENKSLDKFVNVKKTFNLLLNVDDY